MKNDWYAPLRAVRSKGSMAERPGSLAGLAAARRIHEGQFFTPTGVAELMWRIAEPAMRNAKRTLSILDNSVGSGRLLQFADPTLHSLYGMDVDHDAIAALGQAVEAAGFKYCEFEVGGMEMAMPRNMDVALINPPFSLNLQSPSLHPFPCTSYGKFGPGTSALSHAYALAQAVRAAEIVVALLPSPFAAEVAAAPKSVLDDDQAARLVAHIELPRGLFKEESTEVSVSLLVFNAYHANAITHVVLDALDAPLPDFGLALPEHQRKPALGIVGVEDDGPSITLPVTGNTAVRVVHDGRRIGLRYACGLVQAKVHNAILNYRVEAKDPDGERHRYPAGVKFAGQGALDVEVHLAQDDPLASFESLLWTIRRAGGTPLADPGLVGYLHRRAKQHARQATPLRHAIWVKPGTAADVNALTGTARRDHVVDPKRWGSPVVRAGDEIAFQRCNGGFEFALKDKTYRLTAEELADRFEVIEGAAASGWTLAHEGLLVKFPDQAHALRCRAKALGIDTWLTWQYQFEDLIELALKPTGAVAAWSMGLGKARLASALALLSGCKHALITVEAGLLAEMEVELKGLPIPADSWQIIRAPSDLDSLRQINVISYERMRCVVKGRLKTVSAKPPVRYTPVGQGRTAIRYVKPRAPVIQPRKAKSAKWRVADTFAGLLRRRVGTVVSDEGDLLANPDSQQSRCLWHLSAKRRYVLSGTPLANYPRDVLPILAYTAGDGTAAQPYGWRNGYLEARWITSMTYAQRGIDKFREQFVCTEWVTREFEDNLDGAKREIPRIGDLVGYRTLLAPHIKRRITEEPEVAACIRMPTATYTKTTLDWDDAHLKFYLEVAEEFSAWYMEMRRKSGLRGNNLIAILARIQAVCFAQDYPQHGVKGFGTYSRLTSKQRYVVNRLVQLAKEGHKTIVYAENPGLLELIHRELASRNIKGVLFHGGIPAQQRVKSLNEEFRFGDAPVLEASLGVTAKGLNIHQASYAILLSRSWSATVENQAIHRMLRPQQKNLVNVEYVHLDGGIDVYKDMLVSMKANAARSGLDWAEPDTEVDFVHLDTILYRFAESIAALKGVSRHELRQALAAA